MRLLEAVVGLFEEAVGGCSEVVSGVAGVVFLLQAGGGGFYTIPPL